MADGLWRFLNPEPLPSDDEIEEETRRLIGEMSQEDPGGEFAFSEKEALPYTDTHRVLKERQADDVHRALGVAAAPALGVAAGPAVGGALRGIGAMATDVAAAGAVGGVPAAARLLGPKLDAAGRVIADVAAGDAAGPQGLSFGPIPEAKGGKTLYSGLDPTQVQRTAEDIYKASKVAPGLENLPMPRDPSMTAEQAFVMTRAKMASAGETAAERARSLRGGSPEHNAAFEELLHNRDLAQRGLENVRRGEPVKLEGGIDIATAVQRANDAEARLAASPGGQQFLDANLKETDKWRKEMADMAVSSGQMQPGSVRPDYVPHILEERLEDEAVPGLMAGTDAENLVREAIKTKRTELRGFGGAGSSYRPNSLVKEQGEKAAEGSTRKLASDPISRLAVKAASVERRSEMNKFANELAENYAVTKDVLSGAIPFDKRKHGVYEFGGGRLEIFDAETAKAIASAGTREDFSTLARFLGVFNNVARQGLLKFNAKFQIRQIADDFAVGAMNVPFTKIPEFMRRAKHHREVLMAEFEKINNGQFSPIIAEYRRRGTMNEIFESLIDTRDEITKISEKTRQAPGGLSGKLDQLGQVRETSIKSAIADVTEGMGATPGRSAYWANRVTGNFISRSKLGREMNEVFPMMKWYTNAVSRLTKDAATDPVTGKGLSAIFTDPAAVKRGVSSSPWGKIVASALVASTWNYTVSGGKNNDFDGLIIPGTSQKVLIPGYSSMLMQLAEGSDNPEQVALSRLSSPIKMLMERAGGKKPEGGKIDPLRGAVSSNERDRTRAMTGGIGVDNPLLSRLTGGLSSKVGRAYEGLPSALKPVQNLNLSYQGQADVEKFVALAGDVRRLTGEGRAVDAARMVSPLGFEDVKVDRKSDFLRQREAMIQAFADAQSGAERRAVAEKWRSLGGDPMELVKEQERGKKQVPVYQKMDSEKRAKWFDFLRARGG